MTDPAEAMARLDARIVRCRKCPRLVAWREQAAREKRAAYADEDYWARPVPGFGPPDARILVIGLAPAAHGSNRTGRMFTGDRSGDWLFASLFRVGLANQPTSVARDDGLELTGVRMAAPVRCAPPANKPTPEERATCAPWLDDELAVLAPSVRVVVTLGAIGWSAALHALGSAGWSVPRPRPRFGHGAEVRLQPAPGARRTELVVLGCFHPSPHNTFTGRLTEPMTDEVFLRARTLAGMMAP
ncbi:MULTISPECIES: uracil-DNA glycosylase [unclassified Nocardioides]|uniref:uracil-DNA glycosylase n=1 Tax=unclassified Nocardioides TaxID=2615069 RepID=UPI0007028960|nr:MULTISPECIES: uracil-DNA glycosylase [unclassified Nocardioides]KRC54805.1 uracil-DNA glycosylase [Nocardioides sp. Root79]KRC73851.1 uracil-DNA glycosylase [Nocardioides sp. Root240]